ncbi:MAG TPA: NifU family protein [Solirubrobacteraceae bacterium]|nr:NifU family protein [Solirubrobacteraceae bacterium]
MDDTLVREEVEAAEAALAALEELPDGEARARGLAAVEGLLRLYGEALRRIVEQIAPLAAGADALQADELVAHLLLLHGLHPATLEERVDEALEEVRPYMGSHGGGIELIEVVDGVARVRLEGTCSGCAASTLTLKLAVEEAVLRAAPELHAVEAVEDAAARAGPEPDGPTLPVIQGGLPVTPSRWMAVGALAQIDGDGPLRREVGGSALLFARAAGELYAYVDRCPACRSGLGEARLVDDALHCEGCGRRYDVRRAGVGVDGGLMQLDPVPLLVEDGQVRVAIPAVAAA